MLKEFRTKWGPDTYYCQVGALDTGGFAQQFVSALTDVDTVAKDLLGVIRREINGVYKYVQFGASRTTNLTAALAPGDIACYVLGAGSADLNKLTLCDSANSAAGAGVVMGTVPNTGGPYYGWLQLEGVATLGQTSTGANGNTLSTVGAAAKHLAVSAAATTPAYAIMIDASVGAAPVVQCQFPY